MKTPPHGDGGLAPLMVTADRIAHAAFRCAELLTALHRDGSLDRTGSGPVAEVYPAAALKRWRLPNRSYKDPANGAHEARAEILSGLRDRHILPLTTADERELVSTEHLLDALVCALLAHAIITGGCEPIPDHLMDAARAEGWIHLPRVA